MNICGHIIKTELIIGIGPIYVLHHPDPRLRNTHNPVALVFEVHTAERTIEIKSEYYKLGIGPAALDEGEKQDRVLYLKFEEQYYKAVAEISELIGEVQKP